MILFAIACWWIIGTVIATYRYPTAGWKRFGWRAFMACAIWGLSGPLVVFVVAKRYRRIN